MRTVDARAAYAAKSCSRTLLPKVELNQFTVLVRMARIMDYGAFVTICQEQGRTAAYFVNRV
ncbi:MAG: hypothetical protein R3E89_05695 [Thiolinea sp.]